MIKETQIFYKQYKWLAFLGITPFDTEKWTAKTNRCKRWCLLTLFWVYYFLMLSANYEKFQNNFYVTSFHRLVNMLKTLNDIFFLANCFVISFLQKNNWKKFLKILKYIEERPQRNNELRSQSTSSYALKIWTIYFLVVSMLVTSIISIINKKNIRISKMTILHCMRLYQLMALIFLVNILSMMNKFYVNLRKNLVISVTTNCKEEDITGHSVMYQILNELVFIFNKIYGWQIFFFNVGSISAMVYLVNNMLQFSTAIKNVGLISTILGAAHSVMYLVRNAI